MINKNIIIIITSVFIFSLSYNSYASTVDEYEQARFDSGVLRVLLYNKHDREMGHGTGFLINDSGYAVTNHHVIASILKDDDDYGVILNRDKPEAPFHFVVVWSSEDKDLAIIKISNLPESYHPVKITNSEIASIKDMDVIAAGFPAVSEEADLNKMTEAIHKGGQISAKRTMKKDSGPWLLLEHSASIHEGMSGGPVVDRCGRVIGITSFYITKASSVYIKEKGSYEEIDQSELMILGKADGINLAIRSIELVKVLDEEKIDYTYDESGCTTGLNPKSVYIFIVAIILVFLVLIYIVWRRARHNGKGYSKIAKRMSDLSHLVRGGVFSGKNASMIGKGAQVSELVLELTKATQVIGRDPQQCNIILDIDTVSSRHARIGWDKQQKQYWIEDVGSTHGTFVNQERIATSQKILLKNHDSFYFSEPDILFVLDMG